jgi:hypothetical protein
MRKLLLLLAFLSACAAAGGAAAQFMQMRFLPPEGIRGVLGPTQDMPYVAIGNRVLRLTPGARIYDQNNRTIVHSQLPSGAQILFLRDQAGDVLRIYILTEQELAVFKQTGRR